MALVFEYQKTLQTGSLPFICAEKDSTLYNYYMSDDTALDTHAKAPYGQYADVAFANENRHLTTKAVSKIGIKGFPGIGAIGFYKDAYSDESHAIAPIHTERDKTNAPTLTTVEVVNGKLHIVITPPNDISYTCYRVVVRQDPFAFEYIMYKTDYVVDLPTVKGNYYVYCMGYDENTGMVSEDSNELTLTIETGTDNWEPYFETVADLGHRISAIDATLVSNAETLADHTDKLADHEKRLVTIEELGGKTEAKVEFINSSFESASGTSHTRAYTGTPGNMLVMFLMSRGTLSIPPVGWTSVGTLVTNDAAVTYGQYVHVFYKSCEGTESIEYMQSQDSTSMTCIMEFANAARPSLVESTRQENVPTSDTMFVLTKPTRSLFLWTANSIYWPNDDTKLNWTKSNPNVTEITANRGLKPRLGVFLDDRDTTDAFTVGVAMDTRYASAIGISVPGVSIEQTVADLNERVSNLESELDGIGAALDEINGVEV